MSILDEVTTAVNSYRQYLEGCWDNRTTSAEFRPLSKDMPLSYGQCGATSCVLWNELHHAFPEEHFEIATGRVFQGTAPLIYIHTWVSWQGLDLSAVRVIDATADQAQVLPPVVVDSYDILRARRGIVYQPLRRFSTSNDLVTFVERKLGPGFSTMVETLQERFSASSPVHYSRTEQ